MGLSRCGEYRLIVAGAMFHVVSLAVTTIGHCGKTEANVAGVSIYEDPLRQVGLLGGSARTR